MPSKKPDRIHRLNRYEELSDVVKRKDKMGGSREGGLKARDRNIEKYGPDYYRKIGRKGGKIQTEKKRQNSGFGAIRKGKDGLTGPERAKIAGAIGGFKSRRGPSNKSRSGPSKTYQETWKNKRGKSYREQREKAYAAIQKVLENGTDRR